MDYKHLWDICYTSARNLNGRDDIWVDDKRLRHIARKMSLVAIHAKTHEQLIDKLEQVWTDLHKNELRKQQKFEVNKDDGMII